MRLLIAEIGGLWIVQCSNSSQIFFSHKSMMTTYKKLTQIKYESGKIII